MYRRLQSNFGKTKDATFTAGEAMVKGMGVVKDYANKEVALPAAAQGTNIFIVDADPAWTGLLSVENNVSDYDARLNDIDEDDKVTLELLEVGEVYGTDQFATDTYAVNDYLEVGTDGKFAKKASGTSPLVVTIPEYDDAGNTLLVFEVTQTPWA